MSEIIRWLEENASEDDIVDGVVFVGNGRGTNNSNWLVVDYLAFWHFVNGT